MKHGNHSESVTSLLQSSSIVLLMSSAHSDRPTQTCVVRRSNNSFGDRCFAAAGPRVWNTLPIHLRLCDSLEQFKRLNGCSRPICLVFGTAALFNALVRSAVYKSLTYLLMHSAVWLVFLGHTACSHFFSQTMRSRCCWPCSGLFTPSDCS